MLVIDVNTHFGMQAGGNLDLSLPRLVQELDSHRIALAFTGSLRGVSYDHEAGNRETLQATERYPWLLPTATLDLRRYLGLGGGGRAVLAGGGTAVPPLPRVAALDDLAARPLPI